jgi:WD40 repeat protein
VASSRRFALLTAASSGTGEIGVWDVPSGRHVLDRPVASARDTGLTLSLSGRRLAYADHASVTIVDVENGTSRVLTTALAGRAASIRLLFSPDDRWLTRTQVWSTSLQEATTEVWDAGTGVLQHTARGILQAFSRDGQWMLLGRYSVQREAETVAVDTTRWRDARALAGTSGDISANGAVIAVSDREDVTVYQLGRPVTTARIEGASAIFSPDGKRLATISRRRTAEPFVRIWNVDPLFEAPNETPPSGHAGVMPRNPPGLTPEQRWERWQIAFGLTLDDTDQVAPLWRTRSDGQAGPRAIGGIGAK